jgi:hypothetical protein
VRSSIDATAVAMAGMSAGMLESTDRVAAGRSRSMMDGFDAGTRCEGNPPGSTLFQPINPILNTYLLDLKMPPCRSRR